ncbi:hypothetical protein NMY22_g5149 [Coprinellus aureogranulatus]|nr:hypothetical protein NMY22_g5149 [Coprinellus aureogranulatus]
MKHHVLPVSLRLIPEDERETPGGSEMEGARIDTPEVIRSAPTLPNTIQNQASVMGLRLPKTWARTLIPTRASQTASKSTVSTDTGFKPLVPRMHRLWAWDAHPTTHLCVKRGGLSECLIAVVSVYLGVSPGCAGRLVGSVNTAVVELTIHCNNTAPCLFVRPDTSFRVHKESLPFDPSPSASEITLNSPVSRSREPDPRAHLSGTAGWANPTNWFFFFVSQGLLLDGTPIFSDCGTGQRSATWANLVQHPLKFG